MEHRGGVSDRQKEADRLASPPPLAAHCNEPQASHTCTRAQHPPHPSPHRSTGHTCLKELELDQRVGHIPHHRIPQQCAPVQKRLVPEQHPRGVATQRVAVHADGNLGLGAVVADEGEGDEGAPAQGVLHRRHDVRLEDLQVVGGDEAQG